MSVKSRFPEIIATLDGRVELAVRAGAELIKESAKDRVPVNTGALRDSIHVERDGFADWRVVAGNDKAFYGHIVEFGGRYTPAQPFLIPAVEANRIGVQKAVQAALRRL